MAETRFENLAPGATVGHQYQIVKLLGSGGMGSVFLASEIELGRFVAIKFLQPHMLARFEVDARFRREARLLSRLNHPNLVVIHAFGHEAARDLHYIVMEHVPGETLEARLHAAGHLAPDLFRHVMAQVFGAVSEAHRHGIVHRDLKPANVLLTTLAGDPDFVKVLDFGLAKVFASDDASSGVADPAVTVEGTFLGTPYYVAPEQIKGEVVDGRADIYALGVMACELLTGRLPYDAAAGARVVVAHLLETPKLPSQLRPDLKFPGGTGVDAVLARALAKRPEDRYQSVDEFGSSLLAAVKTWAGMPSYRPAAPFSTFRPGPPDPSGEAMSPPRGLTSTHLGSMPTVALSVPMPAPPVLETPVPQNVTVLHLEIEADRAGTTLDLDEQAECLAVAAAKIQYAISAHGGAAVGPLADRQVALFGVDARRLDDTERAVDSALALRSALSSLADDPTIPASFRLGFRVGVDTGRALVGPLGAPGAVVHGAPFFEARRLAQSAAQGEVRISHALYRRVRGIYQSEHVGAKADAGAPDRVVRSRKPLARHIREAEIHGVKIDMIGRDRQLGALRAALREAIETRSPRTVLVTGPAGVGKSRVVSELCKGLEDAAPHDRLYMLEQGNCTPGQPASAYEPFVEAIRSRARIAEADAPNEARIKLEHYVRRFVSSDPTRIEAEDRRLEEVLRVLLGLEEPGDASIGRDQDEVGGDHSGRTMLFEGVTALFRRFAARQPLLFVVENFEWAPEATRMLLGHVRARLGDVPALILLVARVQAGEVPPELPLAREPGAVVHLPIDALERDATEQLVRHALRELVEVPASLVREIASLAEGVPLIVEETVHDLIDKGVIVVGETGWRLAPGMLERVRLPETVEQLLLGRTLHLDPRHREVLEAASVAGRRFWPSLLDELAEGGQRAASLAELVTRGFIAELGEVPLEGEPDYGFCQLAVQEAVYRSVSRARSRQLHRLVATWLERRARGQLAAHDEAIGYHFREGGDPARALPYELRAAERSIRTHAAPQAVRHLECCMEMLREIAPGDLSPAERRRLSRQTAADLVHQLALSGNLQRAVTVADSALADAPDGAADAKPLAHIAISKGRALEHLGRYADARECFLAAQRLAGMATDAGILMLTAVTGEAAMTEKLGDGAACVRILGETLARHDLVAATGVEWERALSTSHRILANAHIHLGEYEPAEKTLHRAYDLALSANAPVALVDSLNALAALHFYQKRPDRAEATWRQALETAERTDLLQHKAVLLTNLGELELSRGDAVVAAGTLRRAEALHVYLGSDEGLADTYRLLGECHLEQGHIEPAQECAARSLEIAERVGSPYFVGQSHRTLAKVAHAVTKAGAGDAARADDVGRHLQASVAAFRAAGMSGELAATEALRERLLGAAEERPR